MKLKDIPVALPADFTCLRSISLAYNPQPDITAYELALILPYFHPGRAFYESDWVALGTSQRHFKRS